MKSIEIEDTYLRYEKATPNFVIRFFQSNKWQFLIFFSIFIPLMFINLFYPGLTSITATNEEVAMIAGAAFAAGLDWSEVISLIAFYWFGFTALLFPVFLIDFSPYIILVIMRAANTALVAFGGVIAFNIMTRIFDMEKKVSFTASIAAACSLYNLIMIAVITNENILIFLDWIILYVLLSMSKKSKDGNSTVALSLILSFLMCYGLLVHTRMIFIWGAVFVFLLSQFIISKKILVNIRVFIPSFLLLYFLSRNLINYVQSELWLLPYDETLVNSIEQVGGSLFSLAGLLERLTVSGLIAFFRTALGQAWSAFVITGGLIPLLFVSLSFVLYSKFRDKRGTMEHNRERPYEENNYLYLASLYTLVQLFAIIVLTAYSTIPTISSLTPDTRWLIYQRYWGPAAGPVVVLSVTLLYKMKKQIASRLIFVSAISLVFLNILFAYFVAPLMYGVRSRSGIFTFYSAMAFWSPGEEPFRATHFFVITIIASTITSVVYFFVSMRKFTFMSVFLLGFFLYNHGFSAIRIGIPNSQQLATEYKHIIHFFSETDISSIDYPRIYVRGHVHSLANIQFNLNRHRIIPITQEAYYPFVDTSQIPIYVTNSVGAGSGSLYMFFGRNHKLVDFGLAGEDISLHYILIDTNNSELVSKVENAGYSLFNFDTLFFEANQLNYLRFNESHEIELPYLAPGDIQFGPYINLPSGLYEVLVTGSGFLNANFSASHSGGVHEIALQELAITNYAATFFFTLESSERQVEFLTANNGCSLIEIEGIRLRILERIPANEIAFASPTLLDEPLIREGE